MRKRKWLVVFSVLLGVVLLGAGFIEWQLAQLGNAIRTLPVGGAQNVALSAMGDIVLDPSVFGPSERAENAAPVLEQYKNNPARVKNRAILTMTWFHASLMAKDLAKTAIPSGRMFSSAELVQVSPDHRNDGWNNPYCVLADDGSVVMMSSGGKGAMNCATLTQAAKTVASQRPDARLRRLTNGVLVTVQPLTPANASEERTHVLEGRYPPSSASSDSAPHQEAVALPSGH
jgi:hypothetical protein